MSEQQPRDQQQPRGRLLCHCCGARVRVLDSPVYGAGGFARWIQALGPEPPRYVLDPATGTIAPFDDPAKLDALALAVADASLAMLDAQDKQLAILEESPAAMVHHGERWIAEIRAAQTATEAAAAKHRAATEALRLARSARAKGEQ